MSFIILVCSMNVTKIMTKLWYTSIDWSKLIQVSLQFSMLREWYTTGKKIISNHILNLVVLLNLIKQIRYFITTEAAVSRIWVNMRILSLISCNLWPLILTIQSLTLILDLYTGRCKSFQMLLNISPSRLNSTAKIVKAIPTEHTVMFELVCFMRPSKTTQWHWNLTPKICSIFITEGYALRGFTSTIRQCKTSRRR